MVDYNVAIYFRCFRRSYLVFKKNAVHTIPVQTYGQMVRSSLGRYTNEVLQYPPKKPLRNCVSE